MNRLFKKLLILLVVAIVQGAIFSNLTFGMSLLPLVYIIFIILLPMRTSQFEMICWGFLLGVAVDLVMGTAGINTIATLAVSYLRIYLLNIFMEKDLVVGGMPLLWRVNSTRLSRYIVALVSLHSLIFFGVESLDITIWDVTLLRYLLSLALTLIFIYLFEVLMSVVIIQERE